MKAHMLSLTIVSVGYQQRSLDELIRLLTIHGVEVLVDVRLNAISRRKGFSKNALDEALNDAGIGYRHEPLLGNPKDNREPFLRGLESARRRYEQHLRNGASASYNDVLRLASRTKVALMCYERDHDSCHRSCILEAAHADQPMLNVLRL